MLLTNSDNSLQIEYTPAKKQQFQKDEFIQTILQSFEEKPEKFIPVIIAESQTQTFFINFAHENEKEKRILLITTSLLLHTFNCTSYTIIFESWVMEFNTQNKEAIEKFEKSHKRFSEYDEKIEKLITIQCNKNNEKEMRFFDIIRNDNKAKLKEDKITKNDFSGVLSGLFNFVEYNQEDKEKLKRIFLNHPKINVWNH